MKNILIIVIGLILLGVAGFFAFRMLGTTSSLFASSKATAQIKDQTFKIELADDQKSQEIGLSDKTSLATDQGMLFDFKAPGFYSFWMKNMKFPIDILFIRDNKIVTIHHDVPIPANGVSQPPTYTSTVEADKVLEITAGLAQKYSIQEGDEITITR